MPAHGPKLPPSALKGSLYDLDPGPGFPDTIRMVVEIPKNSSNKIEYDAEARCFRLDRALYSPMHYPAEYGFVPGTLALDGDPLDALCLLDHPTFTGCLIEIRPIGMIDLIDQTENDQKIIGVPVKDPRYEEIRSIDDIAPHVRKEFEYFFTIYKELENRKVETRGWRDLDHALGIIQESRKRYRELLDGSTGN
jgi:inorganic pyrophosphatase